MPKKVMVPLATALDVVGSIFAHQSSRQLVGRDFETRRGWRIDLNTTCGPRLSIEYHRDISPDPCNPRKERDQSYYVAMLYDEDDEEFKRTLGYNALDGVIKAVMPGYIEAVVRRLLP